jgi:hypothetical protein
MVQTGVLAPLRFFFAFLGVDERNRDISPAHGLSFHPNLYVKERDTPNHSKRAPCHPSNRTRTPIPQNSRNDREG